ncbi:MAG: radical SAM protein [Candidatus Riflebacteria bacterium]|nr:radical SAM protein [Candidatus Riflebacteria bacterium]
MSELPTSAFPLNVMLQTTTTCNAACTFCPHPQIKHEVSLGEMDDALFERVIDELAANGQVLRILMYLMNEPLCDPKLIERIDLAKSRNPRTTVHLLTNGVLLGKLGDRLLQSKLDWLGLSVHALHDDTYEKLMGLKNFNAPGGLRSLMEDFCRKAVELKGPDYVNVKIIRDKRHLGREEAREAVRYWRGLGLERVEYLEEPMSRAGNVRWMPPVRFEAVEGCNSIWAMEMACVLYSGDVIACCNDWRREVPIGNLREQTLAEIWNGEKRRQFLREVYGHEAPRPGLICLKCEAAQPSQKRWDPQVAETHPSEAKVEDAGTELPVGDAVPEPLPGGEPPPGPGDFGTQSEAGPVCEEALSSVAGEATAGQTGVQRVDDPLAGDWGQGPQQELGTTASAIAAPVALVKIRPRRGIVGASKRVRTPVAPKREKLPAPEPRPVAPCAFSGRPAESREPHQLLALEGEPPAILLAELPPGSPHGPSASLLYLSSWLLGNRVRVHAIDFNLASYLAAPDQVRERWDEYADAGYNVPETAAMVARPWAILAPRAVAETVGERPAVLALHVTPASWRVAADFTSKLREANFAAPIYWFGQGSAKELAEVLPAASMPDGFILGDPERPLLELARAARKTGGEGNAGEGPARRPAGVFVPGSSEFMPLVPMQSLAALTLGELAPFHLAGYPSPRLEVLAGIGCSQRCVHCPRAPHGLILRARSADDIYLEMARLWSEKGVSSFVLGQTMANSHPEELTRLAALIEDNELPVTWEARYLPEPDEPEDRYRRLWAGGCRKLRFCIPTAPEGYCLEPYLAKALRLCHWSSIVTSIDTLVAGLPVDPDGQFESLARFLWENAGNIDEVETMSDLLLLPGCELDREPKRFNVDRVGKDLARDWHDNGYLNREFRRKRLKELYLMLEDQHVRLPSRERVLGSPGTLLEQEDRVVKRVNQRVGRPDDAVLATCPVWGYTDPPVALAYLSSYLRGRGYRCSVHDFNTQLYLESPEDMKMLWHVENKNYWSSGDTFPLLKSYYLDHLEKWADELAGSPAKVIGLSVVDPKERMTCELIRRIKVRDQSKRIILGGPAVFTPDYRRIFLDQVGELVDGYVIGEGEATLVDVIEAIKAGRPVGDVPGVVTYPDGVHPRETFRAPIAPLDTVPFPDYQDFDLSRYPSKKLILEWSRGCVNRCAFCKGVAITGKWRNRSPEHILEELTYHAVKNEIHEFEISDQLINGDIEALEEICDRIVAAKLDVRWMCQGLPTPQMTRRVFDKMKAAGCYDFKFGLESASDKVIRLMGKGSSFTRDDAARVIRDCHEAGIESSVFCIVGYPGEEEEDFRQTLDFYSDNAGFVTRIKSINALAIITDTPIHAHAEQFDVVLPPMDYHYLWRTRDGKNTIEVRRERIRRLLAVAKEKGIQVMETNLTEGKQNELVLGIIKGNLSYAQAIDLLKEQVNHLGSFETERRVAGRTGSGPAFVPEPLLPEGAPALDDPTELELLGIMDGRRAFKGPDILEIDMTNDCNVSCAGCWCHSHLMGDRRFAGAFKQHFLPLETIRRLIDDAARMGTRRIQLAGSGEPFMHPQIWDVIRHVKEKGLELAIITNFTLLTEQGVKDLVALGVDDLTCSIWAGSVEAFERTHPGTDGEAFLRLERLMVLLQGLKGAQVKPRVKIYNVISNLNYDDLDNMIDFGLRTGAQYVEFTPVDTIEGYTDSLRLTHEQSEEVLAAFARLQERSDYVNMLGIEHLEVLDNLQHAREAAEFPSRLMKESMYEGFTFHIEHRHTRATCPAGLDSAHVYSDPESATGYVFLFDEERCRKCPLHDKCSINKQNYSVKREFLSFLGFGSFSRRLQGEVEKGEYESGFVNTMPCYIGWSYSRVTTDGFTIPCCKGYGKPLGNLHQASGGFAGLWNSPRMQNFRPLALTVTKDHPYFEPINCVKCCDNLGMNLRTHRKVMALMTDERTRLRGLYDQLDAASASDAGPSARERLLPDEHHAFPEPFSPAELVQVVADGADDGPRNNSQLAEGEAGAAEGVPPVQLTAAELIAFRFK